MDDNKKLTDQGLNPRVAKADSPLSIALIVTSKLSYFVFYFINMHLLLGRDKDVNIERMSTPPPMPEAMRNRENPDNES